MKPTGLNQLVDRVVGRLTHDLRNPLAVVVANLRFVADQLSEGELSEATEESVVAADLLAGMLENASSLEPLRSGKTKPNLGRTRLDTLRTEIDRLVGPMLGSRRLDWNLEPVEVETDGRLVQRILIALVDHCVRRSPPGARIGVSGHLAEDLVLEVVDEGPPFAPGHRPSVLDDEIPVAPAASGAYRSDEGLGLHFVGVATRALGGSATVQARESGRTGVSFRLTIPAART